MGAEILVAAKVAIPPEGFYAHDLNAMGDDD
jgi:hypothetical protein